MKLLNSAQFADLVVDGRNNAYKNFMVNAGKAWDDAYFSDTNDVRAQRLGSSNSAAMIPEFLYDFENQRVITPNMIQTGKMSCIVMLLHSVIISL